MSHACIAAAFILSVLGSASAWAQQDSCQTRTVPVSIMSGDGSLLPDINDAAFKGSYGERSVHINSVTIDQRPRRIILLFDASGSFTYNLDWAFNVAHDMVERIPPPNEIGLMVFATTATPVLPPITDRTKIENEIESLRSTHAASKKQVHIGTALRDAIRDAVKLLGSQKIGDVIFVITDGEDNISRTKPKELVQILVTAGIRLFAVELVDPQDLLGRGRTVEPLDGPDSLYQIVKSTGGVAVVSNSLLELNGVDKHGKLPWGRTVLNSQYEQMLSFYRVDITLPEHVNEQRDWKLALTGSEKAAKNHFILAYPHTVVPCN
jgi:hypothetical protein